MVLFFFFDGKDQDKHLAKFLFFRRKMKILRFWNDMSVNKG